MTKEGRKIGKSFINKQWCNRHHVHNFFVAISNTVFPAVVKENGIWPNMFEGINTGFI